MIAIIHLIIQLTVGYDAERGLTDDATLSGDAPTVEQDSTRRRRQEA